MWRVQIFDAGAPLFLFPWTVSVLLSENRDMKYMSVAYGILVSCVILGRNLGALYTFEKKGDQGTQKPVAQTQCTILLFAFLLLSVSNRMAVIFVCYFAIGFASASLGSLIRNHKLYLRKRYRQKWDGLSVRSEMIRLNIVSFVFFTLLAGLLFDSNTESLLPAFLPCATVSIYFFVVISKNALSEWRAFSTFCRLAKGRVMESVDGSAVLHGEDTGPAVAVDLDIDVASVVIPENYIQAFDNDVVAAKAAYITRLKWRKMYDVDNIIGRPQNFFDEILTFCPHAIHGRSKEGCCVVYELIGQGNPKDLVALGITPELLVWHFNLRNEYIFKKLRKHAAGPVDSETAGADAVTHLMTVIDVKGIGMSDFTADVLSFMKKSGDTIETYYPPRTVVRLVIVNAPYWFSSVWGMIAKVLPESVNKKVVTLRNVSELDQFIDPSQRPVAYGGTDPNPLGKSLDHLGFVQLAKNWEESAIDRIGDIESGGRMDTKMLPSATPPAPPPINTSVVAGRPATSSMAANSPIEKSNSSDSPLSSPARSGGGWFSRFGKTKAAQKEAYLGKSNSYRFDKESQTWVLDGEMPESNTPSKLGKAEAAPSNSKVGSTAQSQKVGPVATGSSKSTSEPSKVNIPSPELVRQRRDTRTGSLDQLEEHGLILAIQAAHKARTGGQAGENEEDDDLGPGPALSRQSSFRKDISSSLGEGTASVVGAIQGLGIYHRKESGATDDNDDHGNDQDDSGERGGKKNGSASSTVMRISGPLFLYVFSAHAVACFCQSCSIWLLPLWVYAPADHGGLNYSVLDFSLVLSTAGILMWIIHVYGYERLQLVVSSSPARAIRIGCGSMAFAIFFFPTLASATIFSTSAGGTAGQGMFLTAQPSSSPTALVVPSLLVALLVTGSYVTRVATMTILATSLKNSFAMPDTVISALSAVMDVAGPCVGGVMFSLFYRDHLFALPLQSFVVMYGVIILLGLLYSSTLLLNVHFRGDFGIVTERVVDIQDSRRNRCLQCISGDTYVPMRGREGDGAYYILRGYALTLTQAAVNCVLDVIAVPHGDLQFLVSPVDAVASHGGHIARSISSGRLSSSRSYKNV